ncbi:MAG: hypothetical protein ABIJ16_09410 [Bacteroidota bacterium]
MKGRISIDTWDDGGKTVDRYTITISGVQWIGDTEYTYFISSSSNPKHPQGFWQHGHEVETKQYNRESHGHLGKRISFFALPEEVQACIRSEITLTD